MSDDALPAGAVAAFRLPIPVGSVGALTRAVEAIYGPGCIIDTQHPTLWLVWPAGSVRTSATAR